MQLKLPIMSPHQPPFDLSFRALYKAHSHQALLQVQASDEASTDHAPSTLVLVLDVSGSMASAATTADDSDGDSGLSQLDIVRHASLTLLEALGDQDRLAIVSFHTTAQIVFPLTYLTKPAKAQAQEAIKALTPMGSTNLYGGLHMALELLRTHPSTMDTSVSTTTLPSNPCIFLLTDGLPNISPPRGELATLQNYLDTHTVMHQVRLSTFGFGYSLHSKLLADIAALGRSLFGFIPDSSFVGTVFVNAIANTLACACATSTIMQLEASEGVQLLGCTTGQSTKRTEWGLQIELPSLLYGQSLDVLVQWKGTPVQEGAPPFLAFLEFEGQDQGLSAEPHGIDPFTHPSEELLFRKAGIRAALVGFIQSVGQCSSPSDLAASQATLYDWKGKSRQLVPVSGSTALDHEICHAISQILQDLEGQVTEAYSRWDWHTRWGRHYVLSLLAAHTLQQCSNFKDPGLQTYLTQKVTALRDAAEERFLALPPPQPSRGTPKAPVQSMRTFYNASSGCFGGGPVLLADRSRKDISLLRAGDQLYSDEGPVTIQCVVETESANGLEGLVSLPGGVTVTPWHPIRIEGDCEWVFPYKIAFPQWKKCDRVFNLVLEGGSSFQIGGFNAVSLGHGLQSDPIAAHAYFGTERVIDDLRKLEGWTHGHVVLPLEPFKRDPQTGQVMGIKTSERDESRIEVAAQISPS